jgi:LmbE family N-acetylglucosaminyl deacetylase
LVREGFEPHVVSTVWISGTNPTMVVDITKVFDLKYAALKRHQSQVGGRVGLKKMLKSWARLNAKNAGLGKGRLGESFKVVNTR